MRVTYDRDVDVLSILLSDAEVEETRNVAPGVEIDFDGEGRVLSVEFLNAGEKYNIESINFEEPDECYTLAEAGAISGISPVTLRHQIERGVLKAFKLGRNWMVYLKDLDAYVNEHSRKIKS